MVRKYESPKKRKSQERRAGVASETGESHQAGTPIFLQEGRAPRPSGTQRNDAGQVGSIAADGIADASAPLPHTDRIQKSFGNFDISGVRAAVGGRAAKASAAIGAEAYTTGDRVAFAKSPDVWTAAHEAAHVVQQRNPIGPRGGLGRVDDRYERQADAVANAVIRGESAGAYLDRVGSASGQNGLASRSAGHVVQRRPAAVESYVVQRGDTLEAIAEEYGVSVAHLIDANRALIRTWTTPGGGSVKGFNTGETIQIPTASIAGSSPTSESDQDGSSEDGWGLVDSLLSGVSDIIDRTTDAARGIVTAIAGLLVSAKRSFIGDGDGEAGSPDDAAISERQARETRREELLAGGKKTNLAVAKTLADATAMPHHYDDPSRSKKSHAPTDILAGNEQAAQSILCSGFTALTLVKAGWDLSQEYIDPATGLPIAYEENDGKLTFINLFMITNQQPKAIAGVLEAKKGDALKVEGSDVSSYVASGKFPQTPPAQRRAFLLSESATFVGLEATGEEEVGAGLTAVALGGIEVDPKDRKPGDLQQTMKTDSSGKFTGAGHSSQVWSVRGIGVCYLGANDSPTIIPPNVTNPAPLDELEKGWYEINDESGLFWLVDKDTSPDHVATLRADYIQLIDANVGRSGDATAVGTTSRAKEFHSGTTSEVTSNGRLPTSKWIAWVRNDRVPIRALLSNRS